MTAVQTRWLEEIDKSIVAGEVNVYDVVALNRILGKLEVRPEYMSDFCMEVDDHDDLKIAQEYLST